jgi:hypothetical protein
VEHVVEDMTQAGWKILSGSTGLGVNRATAFEVMRNGFRRFIWTRVRGIALSGRRHRIVSLASSAGELETLSLECVAAVACELEPVFAGLRDALAVAYRIAERIERILGRYLLDPVKIAPVRIRAVSAHPRLAMSPVVAGILPSVST